MTRVSVVAMSVVAVGLAAGNTRGGTPFGGDDAGFVPPNAAVASCEHKVAKEGAKLVAALTKCNVRDSDSNFRNLPFDGAACQATAVSRFGTTVAALDCPACLDRGDYAASLVGLTNVVFNGGTVFCANSGTPQDPPQSGFVPPTLAIAKAEDAVAKAAGKLMVAATLCHIDDAKAGSQGKPFDEEACERRAADTFDLRTPPVAAAPPCLAPGLSDDGPSPLGDYYRTLFDGLNGRVYCASPSGAFLNPASEINRESRTE